MSKYCKWKHFSGKIFCVKFSLRYNFCGSCYVAFSRRSNYLLRRISVFLIFVGQATQNNLPPTKMYPFTVMHMNVIVKHTPLLSAYPLLSTYTLPAFNPFLLSACVYCIRSIKHLHALRVELKLLRKLQENRLLQSIGDTTATGEAIITGELMATGQDKINVQNVQTMRDGGIIASWDCHFVCWLSSVARRFACWPSC